jgi:hypothetical protein
MNNKKVRVRDRETGRVFEMPAAELVPGMIRAQMVDESGKLYEPVWEHMEDFKEGPYRRPPFGEQYLPIFQALKTVLDDALPSSLEEWEDGFRRDANPHREMFYWLIIAGQYLHFTQERKLSLEQKRDILDVIIACANNGTDFALQTVG